MVDLGDKRHGVKAGFATEGRTKEAAEGVAAHVAALPSPRVLSGAR